MATCKQQAFVLATKFTWILYCAGAAATQIPCTVTVNQLQFLEANITSSNITIPCTFSTKGCPSSSPTVLWFRYLAHTHEGLCTPKCTKSEKFQVTSTVPENQASLRISNITIEDSAIYFCGVAFPDSNDFTSKQTGEGTTLTIRASKKHSQGVYVMTTISSFLFFYIAAILATFKFFSKSKGSGRSISRAIAEELRKKKHRLNYRPRHSEKETIYQNR
ncbi:immunoglobulin superfamily member 6 isoform X2 [Eublepharis macularius]|uniref:immunoglobulin superfamily member 6 isoform X2 n=1 Tax=Eublepharis macularius TaxID=481883 RepID=UPI0024102365|nr:immunoglobulin superfamily member 6 isoform X2 [Eublepharis macularius]